ncbi:MAG: BamA/TamA family outer membrane protein, partial [Calditrichaeota bacterium]|nr:BamA/TamA family outer membrane protein [Calditrichota bacterium]
MTDFANKFIALLKEKYSGVPHLAGGVHLPFHLTLIFLITSFLLISDNYLLSQTDTSFVIKSVHVTGNHLLSEKQIKRLFSQKKYTRQALEKILENIAQLYREKSFPFTKIEGENSDSALLVTIDEGAEIRLNALHLDAPDSDLVEELAALLDLRDRNRVAETVFFNIENLLFYLENNGFPFAQIEIDSLAVKEAKDRKITSLDFFLKISPGQRVYLDEIHVSGNHLTKKNVILREARLKIGSIFKQNQISRLPERLMKTGFFTAVQEPKIAVDENGKGHLLIDVTEGNPNQLNAVIGYTPATNPEEKGYFTGLIDIAFKNLLGTGRLLETYWQKKDRNSQELRFHYVERWVLGYPLHAGFGFEQTIRDTTYVRRSIGVDFDVPFSDLLTIHSHFGKESILPDSLGQILFGLPRSNSNLARIGFSYDSRENPWNPARGLFYHTRYEFARKKISSLPALIADSVSYSGTFRRERIEMDAELYVPTFRYQTILVGLHGRQVKSNEEKLSVADLYRLGGTNTLRGYREDEFLGERLAWLNLEYRYLLGPRSRAFLFFDAGYIMRAKENHKIPEQTKFSYGFGFRIETRLGIIGVDYGIGQGRGLA